MSFIGLDIGSSSIKAAVLATETAEVLQVRARPFPNPVEGLPALHFEIEPEPVVALVRELIAELLPLCPSPCRGILTCSQMGGVLLVTPDGQRPLTNYLSWRDQRVLETCPSGGTCFERLQQRTTAADLAVIGRELRPGSTVGQLWWLRENDLLPTDAVAVSLADFVIARLCQTAPRQEVTLALGTLNLGTRDWYRDWFERLGLSAVDWPPLSAWNEPVGKLTIAGQPIPCYPAVGDQQAALYGAQLVEGELSLNISTGSQVSRLTSVPQPGEYQIRPYFDGLYLSTITHLPAGRSLNALVDLLGELPAALGQPLRDPWAAITRAVDAVPATDLQANLAFFAGSLGDCGSLKNMRLENLTVGHLFLSAFEAMARNYEQCAGRVFPERDWSRMVLTGGLAQRLPRLRQCLSERLGSEQRSLDTAEETLQGLLLLGRRLE